MPKLKKDLPNPPKSFLALLGPGLVLIAMGLGSGEFILWPYFVSQFGFGIIWGALVGILFQYFVSNETGRYTLATGDSVFFGFKNLSRWFPAWFILSTFLSFAWPGIIGTGGEILGKLLGVTDFKWLTILMLVTIGLIFTFGGKVYSTLEKTQKIFLLISLPILVLILVILVNPTTLLEVSKGFLGFGSGYFLFPTGIAQGQFLGAIAYAGAAGNLILSHSFYIQDKGLGMAEFSKSEIDLHKKSILVEQNNSLKLTAENIKKFKKWFRVVSIEQFISFVLLGLSVIIILSVIAFELVYPAATKNDLSFIYLEAENLAIISPIFSTFFLVIGVLFLFTTQLGVFESTSRIMSENLQIGFSAFTKTSRSKIFFSFLWLQILFAIGIVFLEIAAPIEILFINTTFSAVSMFVLSGAIYWLNTSKNIAKEIQPGIFRKIILLLSFVFFGVFSLVAVLNF